MGVRRYLIYKRHHWRKIWEFMDPQRLDTQVNKANRLLGLIRRSFDFLDCDAIKLLFAALVRPYLEVGNYVRTPYLKRIRS